ncbi:MAG: phosphatase PAP2 family protein [Candidatus Cryptobacteroides sp.]
MFETLDQNISLAINSLNCPVSDQIWIWFSNKLIWIPLYLLIIVLLIHKLGWKKGLICVLAIALCILCVDQVCNLVKNSVQRLRPCNNHDMVERGLHMLAGASKSHPYGFFSAHAANAMAFAVCSAKFLKRGGPVLCLWAVLVGLSRVFVGKHFLGDVLVGFAAGLVFALIFSALTQLLFKTRTAETSLPADRV